MLEIFYLFPNGKFATHSIWWKIKSYHYASCNFDKQFISIHLYYNYHCKWRKSYIFISRWWSNWCISFPFPITKTFSPISKLTHYQWKIVPGVVNPKSCISNNWGQVIILSPSTILQFSIKQTLFHFHIFH